MPTSLKTPVFALLPLVAALAASPAFSAGFTITGASTGAQSVGKNDTGTVNAGATLTVSGSSVAVTVTGNNATINNQGTIKQTGTGRGLRDNTGVTGLVVDNGSAANAGALIQTADADVFQMNQATGGVTVDNYGRMISLNASAGGAQVLDFDAVLTGAIFVNNYAGALMQASEGDAVRFGGTTTLYNAGTIQALSKVNGSKDGVSMGTHSGGSVTNDAGGRIEGARHGITGKQADAATAFAATIVNKAFGQVIGDNGSGINIDGVNGKELVTIRNGGLISGYGKTGDGDGVDVDGLVDLVNTGLITSGNAVPDAGESLAFSEGVSVGGGTITNSGTIEGLVAAGNTQAVGRGITLVGNDVAGSSTREGLYGNAVVDNLAGGLIHGQTDSAIVVAGAKSGFTVAIDNAAGATILGGGAAAPAILGGLDNDTVSNGGKIDGSSSGKAINLGGGDNTLNILGGQAAVLGDVDGGAGGKNALNFTLGVGNGFAYAGSLSDFSAVDVQSGTVTLSGASTYTGATTVESGATLELDGAGRLAAGSSLALAGGTLRLADVAGAADAQAFASLALSGHSTLDLGGSSVTFDALGTAADGSTLAGEDWNPATSGYALRFLGDLEGDAGFAAFLADVTVDGHRASEHFDGTYTDITAIPEPADAALLLAGLGLLGAAARRRRG
jgi:autotransporter-associated beta strand protein